MKKELTLIENSIRSRMLVNLDKLIIAVEVKDRYGIHKHTEVRLEESVCFDVAETIAMIQNEGN